MKSVTTNSHSTKTSKATISRPTWSKSF
jgi:hypothetical protein